MTVPPFKMSDSLREQAHGVMLALNADKRGQLLGVLASLAAEVQLHITRRSLEDLRIQWSEVLDTMFLKEPRRDRKDQRGAGD